MPVLKLCSYDIGFKYEHFIIFSLIWLCLNVVIIVQYVIRSIFVLLSNKPNMGMSELCSLLLNIRMSWTSGKSKCGSNSEGLMQKGLRWSLTIGAGRNFSHSSINSEMVCLFLAEIWNVPGLIKNPTLVRSVKRVCSFPSFKRYRESRNLLASVIQYLQS